jgi:hypothetical protein
MGSVSREAPGGPGWRQENLARRGEQEVTEEPVLEGLRAILKE